MAALLTLDKLAKTFHLYEAEQTIEACQNISFEVQPGEFVGITGKSGSGKSTILKCIYRTNLASSGSIVYDSAAFGPVEITTLEERKMLHIRRYEIAYISQFLSVLPRQSAKQIVVDSAKDAYEEKSEQEEAAIEMLKHFEIAEHLWNVFPNTFSGGEKLRLNIAAAMVKHPRFLLLDEPTASLDNASKVKVRELIEKLKSEGTTMLGIFHDLEFMEGLCDKEFNMQKGSFV